MTETFWVEGMDCPSCAGKIESAVARVPGVRSVKVSTVSRQMTVTVEDVVERDLIEEAVQKAGYQVQAPEGGDTTGPLHRRPGYRRALWLVVVLNAGFGVVEMAGGFLADSQALKADALDFIGDGAITLLGLLALTWSMTWRARAALLQGIFLATLGLGVLGSTVYRVVVVRAPEAELMGVLAVVALVVNVVAALILMPYRGGDANARAVWLFSRNDALGNLAVLIAAGLVAWLNNPWPDLVVAALIASLFLHAAQSIIKDSVEELRAAFIPQTGS